MKFLKQEIERYERRIKQIQENPDPTKPKANIILYELERDLRKHQLDMAKKGKLFATGMYPAALLSALGFEVLDAIMAADRTSGSRAAVYMNQVRSQGLPEQTCDRTVIYLPMILSGDFPKPDFIVAMNWECECIPLSGIALGRLLEVPIYYVDVSFEADNETLSYVTDQFRELIEFAERKFPGIKYNEERLIELQAVDKAWYDVWKEIYELRKIKPCPIRGREAFREPRAPSLYHDPQKALEYLKLYRDDLNEMVEKGIGAVENEKLRVMWAVSGPFFADPFKTLEQKGVSIPYWHIGEGSRFSGAGFPYYGDETEYGRKLSPLEDEARMFNCSGWGGLGKRWVEDTVFVCKDLDIDAVVYYQLWGCTVTENLGKMVAEVLEKELNIPTLLVEGRCLDEETYDEKELNNKLEDFIEMCFSMEEHGQG